jgi:hypothetical protein
VNRELAKHVTEIVIGPRSDNNPLRIPDGDHNGAGYGVRGRKLFVAIG